MERSCFFLQARIDFLQIVRYAIPGVFLLDQFSPLKGHPIVKGVIGKESDALAGKLLWRIGNQEVLIIPHL
jgi:hypothetical protein